MLTIMTVTDHLAVEREPSVHEDLGYSKTPQAASEVSALLSGVVEVQPLPVHEWTLDEATIAIGRRGIEQARAALRASNDPRH